MLFHPELLFLSHLGLGVCLCGSVCTHVCVCLGSCWERRTSRSPRSTRRAGKWGQRSSYTHTHTHSIICFLDIMFCDCRDSKGRRGLQDPQVLSGLRWAQLCDSVLLRNIASCRVRHVCIGVIDPITCVCVSGQIRWIRSNRRQRTPRGTRCTWRAWFTWDCWEGRWKGRSTQSLTHKH